MLRVYSALKLFNISCSADDRVSNVIERVSSARDHTSWRTLVMYLLPSSSLWAGSPHPHYIVQPNTTISDLAAKLACGSHILYLEFVTRNGELSLCSTSEQCPTVITIPSSPSSHSCMVQCVEENQTAQVNCSSGITSASPVPYIRNYSDSSVVIDLVEREEEEEVMVIEKDCDHLHTCKSKLCQILPEGELDSDDDIIVITESFTKEDVPDNSGDVTLLNNQMTLTQSVGDTTKTAGVSHSSEEHGRHVLAIESDSDDVKILRVEGEGVVREEQIASVLRAEMRRHPHIKWTTRVALHHLKQKFGDSVIKKRHFIRQFVKHMHHLSILSPPPPPPPPLVTNCCGILLNSADLQTLGPNQWLNDQVISAFMQLLMKSYKDVHITSTFFYSKLKLAGYKGIKRWIKKVRVFELSQLLIPVHLVNHWCLVAVDIKKQRIEYYDSLAGTNKECMKRVFFLLLRLMRREKQTRSLIKFKKVYVEKSPRQFNSYDCGVFVCEYARWVCYRTRQSSTDTTIPLTQCNMTSSRLRRRILRELLEQRIIIH